MSIRFYLNGLLTEVRDLDPNMTVLSYLRYHRRLTGTKEGCAEGDCGACTAVLGTLRNGTVRYCAVNTCILFLPQLDGKELITVEGIAGPNGSLHPVQRAMVASDASQCGFCTPGIVMSLYAHYRAGGETAVPVLNDALAGNLCRCTGYGPILAAAQRMYDLPAPAPDEGAVERLSAIERKDMLAYTYDCPQSGVTKWYFAPRSLLELSSTLQDYPHATILAGATDVGLWVTKQLKSLDTVVSIGAVEELNRVIETEDTIEIGAGVSYADAHECIGRCFPDFGEVIRRLGSVQIRNSGTMGGNIANGSPIGDSMPPLIALGASLVLRGDDRIRTIPLEDYFIAYGRQDRKPGEFVEKLIVPKLRPGQSFRAYKISKRFDQDISALCGAFSIFRDGDTVTQARICFGGMAATPKRAAHCEAALTGRPWAEQTVENAVKALERDFAPISDMRASARYRMTAALNLLRKAYLETVEPGRRLRVVGYG